MNRGNGGRVDAVRCLDNRPQAITLYGSCGNFGAQRMMDLCRAVEAAGKKDDVIAAGPLVVRLKGEYEIVRNELMGLVSH